MDEPVYSGWFSPPESRTLARPTPAFDVFMLGQTIYHLISGGQKYRRKGVASPDVAVDQFLSRSAGPVLTELIRKMVVENVHDRMQSMSEVVRAIDEAFGSVFRTNNIGDLCTVCGAASYEKIDGLQLTTAHLTVTRNARAVPLGNREIVLFACPKCGSCRFQLDDSGRRALFSV
jgi:hypothetical protein